MRLCGVKGLGECDVIGVGCGGKVSDRSHGEGKKRKNGKK